MGRRVIEPPDERGKCGCAALGRLTYAMRLSLQKACHFAGPWGCLLDHFAVAGAGNLMLVKLIIPPIAILLGWAFLDERLTTEAFVGFALIGAGLVVIDGRVFNR